MNDPSARQERVGESEEDGPMIRRRAVALFVAALSLASTGAAAAVGTDATPAAPLVSPSVVVSAHRGGSAYAPENTMYAYRNAVRIGVDQMETDTWLTKDGVLVLIHDGTLNRTTNCKGNVTAYTYAELRNCNAGWWWTPGQGVTSPDDKKPHPLRGLKIHVPAAAELFSYIKSFGPTDRHTINIEIKDISFVASANALVKLIQQSGLKRRVIVQSFYPPALDYVKLLDGSIQTALLTEGVSTPYVAYSMPLRHDWISSSNTDADLNATTVRLMHTLGRKVIPWTPDSRDAMLKMGLIGVDAIITNYPGCLLKLEGRKTPKSLIPAASIKAGVKPSSVSVCEQ